MQTLKEAVEPYLFFWSEWTKNDNCNLTPSEINLINYHIRNDFQYDFFGTFWKNIKNNELEIVLGKLERGYQVFKQFVIVNFLQKIIDIAIKYGYPAFLKMPIRCLKIDVEVKRVLLKLNTRNLQLAFSLYKPEDFTRNCFFEIVKEFQIICKRKTECSNL